MLPDTIKTVTKQQNIEAPQVSPITNTDNSLLVTPTLPGSNNVDDSNSGTKSQSNNDITNSNEEDKILIKPDPFKVFFRMFTSNIFVRNLCYF